MFVGVFAVICLYCFVCSSLNDDSSSVSHAIFVAAMQNMTGIIFAWLILVFESGTFSCIDNFVLHKIWKPLGRLTFCIYLVHPVIINFYILKRKELIDIDNDYTVSFSIFSPDNKKFLNSPFQLSIIFAVLPLTFVFSIITHLLVEVPFTKVQVCFSSYLSQLISKNTSDKKDS